MINDLYSYLNIVEKWAIYREGVNKKYILNFIHPKTDQPPINHTMTKDNGKDMIKIVVETTVSRVKSVLDSYITNNDKTKIVRKGVDCVDVNLKFIPKNLNITQLDINLKAQDFINSLHFFNGIRGDIEIEEEYKGADNFSFIMAGDVIPSIIYTERKTYTPIAECTIQLHYNYIKEFDSPFLIAEKLSGTITAHNEKLKAEG